MKKFFLLFPAALVVGACSSSTTGDDAGNPSDGSANDVVSGDALLKNDGSPTDASTDAANDVSTGGDGGLGPGEICDPQNNQCKSGLLCCSEPTHIADAMTGFFCEQPSNGNCPLLP